MIFTRNGAVTPLGWEISPRLRASREPGQRSTRHRLDPSYDVTPALRPLQDELVVDKLTSSAFHQTALDHALRNLRVEDVVMVGCMTDMCVLGSARAAAELGYNVLVVDDACVTLTDRAHDEALLAHARVFGRVGYTAATIAELDTLLAKAPN